jgi:hypothetical protein
MPGGRPILYKPENADIARLACMLGATNDTLADRFEVSPRAVDNWIAAIPEFGDAVRQGRQVADESVVSALFARATGMERKVTKAFCHKGQPITVSYTVELPPDVRACMFWLRNRRPGQWRENRPLIDERDDLDFRGLEEASQRAALADRDKSPEAAPVRGGPDALPPPSPPLNIVVSSVPPLRNCPLFHCLTFGVHYIRRRMRRHRSGALIGANFADISNDNLILRSRAKRGVSKDGRRTGSWKRPVCSACLVANPSRRTAAVLLRVRSRCQLAPTTFPPAAPSRAGRVPPLHPSPRARAAAP